MKALLFIGLVSLLAYGSESSASSLFDGRSIMVTDAPSLNELAEKGAVGALQEHALLCRWLKVQFPHNHFVNCDSKFESQSVFAAAAAAASEEGKSIVAIQVIWQILMTDFGANPEVKYDGNNLTAMIFAEWFHYEEKARAPLLKAAIKIASLPDEVQTVEHVYAGQARDEWEEEWRREENLTGFHSDEAVSTMYEAFQVSLQESQALLARLLIPDLAQVVADFSKVTNLETFKGQLKERRALKECGGDYSLPSQDDRESRNYQEVTLTALGFVPKSRIKKCASAGGKDAGGKGRQIVRTSSVLPQRPQKKKQKREGNVLPSDGVESKICDAKQSSKA